MRLTGTVRFEDIGTGYWYIETPEGNYDLLGPVTRDHQDKVVTVEGELLEDTVSTAVLTTDKFLVKDIVVDE